MQNSVPTLNQMTNTRNASKYLSVGIQISPFNNYPFKIIQTQDLTTKEDGEE